MAKLIYNFEGCVNQAEFDDPIIQAGILAIINGSAYIEKMTGHPIYKIRLTWPGETTQPRLLFCGVPSAGRAYFAVLDVVFDHDYHKSKYLKPGMVSQFLTRNSSRFLEQSQQLSMPWVSVEHDMTARYYHGQFMRPTAAQYEAVDLTLPAVVSGLAGSGKTYVLLEKAIRMSHPVRYVANSSLLVQQVRDGLGAQTSVVCQTYEEMLREGDVFCQPDNKSSDADCLQWIKQHVSDLDPIAVFEEFRIISIYATNRDVFTEAAYLSLGKRHSLFPIDRRDYLLNRFKTYVDVLNQMGLWHPAFYIPTDWSPCYEAMMVDEAFDLSRLQLMVLFYKTRASHICYAGDSHQRLQDRISVRPFLMESIRSLTGHVHHSELPISHRCPDKILVWLNDIIEKKIALTGGIADKWETASVALSHETNKPQGMLFALNNAERLRAMFPSDQWAVITPLQSVAEAKIYFNTSLVFTPSEIKGLEYPYIITYALMSDPLWPSASKKLGTMTSPIRKGRSVDDSGDLKYAPLFNELIVALTRATQGVFVVERAQNERLRHLFNQDCFLPTSGLDVCLSHIQANTLPDEASWENHATMLLKNGCEAQAKGIFLRELHRTEEEYQAFKAAHVPQLAPVSIEVKAAAHSAPTLAVVPSPVSVAQNTEVIIQEPVQFQELMTYDIEGVFSMLENFNIGTLERWFGSDKALPCFFGTIQTEKGYSSFLEMILRRSEHTAIFEDFLASNRPLIAKINGQTCYPVKCTAIHLATTYGHIRLLELLLSCCENINVPDIHTRTPLFFALTFGQLDAINLLLKHGASFEHIYDMGNIPSAELVPFYVAMDYGSLSYIHALQDKSLKLYPWVRAGFIPGTPRLFLAAQAGKYSMVDLYLKLGDDALINDTTGENDATALLIAVQHGHLDVVKLLVTAGADMNQPLKNGAAALYLAIAFNYYDIFFFLLNYGADPNQPTHDGYTPLMAATHWNREECTASLIQAEADLDYCHPKYGWTSREIGELSESKIAALFSFEKRREILIHRLFKQFNYAHLRELCQLNGKSAILFKRKVRINKILTDRYVLEEILIDTARTKLFCQFLQDDPLGSRLLAQLKSQFVVLDRLTAVHLAVKAKAVDFIKLCSDYRFDMDSPTHGGLRPIHFAVENNDRACVSALIEAGVDTVYELNNYPTPLYQVISYDVNNSHAGIFCVLLKATDVTFISKLKYNPLCLATLKNNRAYVEHLLRRGAPVDSPNAEGLVPLLIAIEAGLLDMVKLLLKYQANLYAMTPSGLNALQLARANNENDIVSLICNSVQQSLSDSNRFFATPVAQLGETQDSSLSRSALGSGNG